MNLIACGLAVFLLVNIGDRLRLVNWRTAKVHVVALLLIEFSVGAAGLYEGATGTVPWWLWALMLATLLVLHYSRPAWREGVPDAARSGHGELGPPEIQR